MLVITSSTPHLKEVVGEQLLSGLWPGSSCPQVGGEDPSGKDHSGEDLAVP